MRVPALLLGPLLFGVCLWPPQLPAKDKSTQPTKQTKDFSKFVDIPGAEKVGSGAVPAMPQEPAKIYRRSLHAMQDVTCEQCHGAGSLHVAAGAYSKEKIISFRDRSAESQQRSVPELPLQVGARPQLVLRRAPGAGPQVHGLPHHPWRCQNRAARRLSLSTN